MDIELTKLLQQTGFTEKEARVYLALLEIGKGDVTDIAKISELKRSIVYVLVDGLVEKGYVTQIPGGKINTYQASDPGLIHNQIKTTTRHLGEMLPFLRSLHNKGTKKPRMQYIESLDGMLKVFYDAANYDNQFYVSSYWRITKYFPGELEVWTEKNKKSKIFGRHLITNDPRELEFAKHLISAGHKVKTLPEMETMAMDFAVFGNNLAISSLEDDPFMILMQSEEMIKSIMPIFEIAWRSGKEMAWH